jgi:predicted dehydrogenase
VLRQESLWVVVPVQGVNIKTEEHDSSATDLDLIDTLGLKAKRDYGIAIVGAGSIVRFAHLPAYRRCGLRVLGVTDVDLNRAGILAKDLDVPKVYADLSELLSDDEVQIVDIAVPASVQPDIACQVLESGRNVLCQKPFADNYASARRVVELAEARSLKLAVNQQMRWTPAMRAVKELIRRGWLGHVLRAEFDINLWEGLTGWLTEVDPFDLIYYSIHYYDVSRFLYGEPEWVYSICGRWPCQTMMGETRTNTLLEYSTGLQLLHRTNHCNITKDNYATFRVEGTDGVVKGTLGVHYGYPHGRPDAIEFMTKHYMPSYWLQPRFQERWMPDAFVGPMLSLIESIATGSEPATSGRDNLNSLRLAFAVRKSQACHRPVNLAEFDPNDE